ncbi:MAG: hypothetical protein GX312_03475 [Candidatus Phytoplasma sp.]|nr:hypothetical protein [Phytoplasma sp.]
MSIQKKSLLTLTIVFIISVTLVVISGMLLTPLIDQKEKRAIITEAKTIFNQADDVFLYKTNKDPKSIEVKASVLKEETKIGFIIKAKKDNEFGQIEVLIGIKPDDKISEVKIITLNQSMYQEETKKAASEYKGLDITKLTDANSGATSVSIQTLDDLIKDMSQAYLNIEKEPTKPYETWFGSDYQIESQNENITQNIILKEVIKDQGFVYTIEKSGYYHNGEGQIRVVLILDVNYKILGVLLPEEHYGHSKGSFYTSVLEYVETLENQDLTSFPDEFSGASEGTGNSRKLIFDMINLVKEEILK